MTVEYEDDNDLLEGESKEESSFNDSVYPAEVRVNREQYACSHIKTLVEKRHEVELSPDFQRNDVWKNNQKSELIESILMGIPIPVIYLFENKDGIKQVVDGKQRISTIIDFQNEKITLKNLRILDELNNKTFSQLPPKLQAKFEDYQLFCYIIQPPTPERIKYDIFDRVNRAGTRINHQEMREALYRGVATDILKKLCDSPEFLNATENGISPNRRKDHYIVLRCLAFMLIYNKHEEIIQLNGSEIEYRSDMDDFLAKIMIFLNEKADENIINYCIDGFISAMKRTIKIMGADAFRLPSKGYARRPINMPLFEMMVYILADKRSETSPVLTKTLINNFKEEWDKDEDFQKSNMDSTLKIINRFDEAKKILEQL